MNFFIVKVVKTNPYINTLFAKEGDTFQVKNGYLIDFSGFHWGRGDFNTLEDINEFFKPLNTVFKLYYLN